MAIFYVISTPIGNLEDVTLRAIRVLKEADIVLCEDTRVTKRLFEKHAISSPMLSYHAHSGESKVESIFEEIEKGKNIALVTDAGTPGISDPGSLLISHIRTKYPDLKIEAIPGPSALTAALSVAGVPTDEFTFLGFLPHKKGRQTLFREIAESDRTMVFYESTHRILKTLESLKGINKKVTIVREITKIYEEVLQGSAEDILKIMETIPEKQKGEFVVIVSVL
ncbi:MAG: 16S rRNA (cytidine(1402)-2'-O)-methyltransferase [bacterium]|nr:16S rRNA (cytidine(1402)-2'-O)-methyltransferase [bacterium]